MAVSTTPDQTLVTYSLGSCVGVSLFDPEAGVGGLIHCMVPLSKTDPEKAKVRPAMFTDTGFVLLLNEIIAQGASINRLIVKVAGGGAPMDSAGRFKIGERNYAVLRKLLWKNNLLIAGEDVGGTKPRTMRIQMSDGLVTVSSAGEVTEL
jgi:chemotaxis protein CheD